MKDPSEQLQRAVYKTLMESPAMAAAFNGEPKVYDPPPQNVAPNFTYCTLGENQIIGTTNSCHDSSEAFVKVDVWSSAKSRSECMKIGAAVAYVLDAEIAVTGFQTATHTLVSLQHMQDRNRELFHSVVSLRYDLVPTS